MSRKPVTKVATVHPFQEGKTVAWAAGLKPDIRLGLVERNGTGPFRVRKAVRLDKHLRQALRDPSATHGYYIDGLQPNILVSGSLLRAA